MNELFSVKDKVVHVSGGAGGIGRRIAEAFAEGDAKVIVSSRREAALKGTGLDYRVCDITDPAQIERCVEGIVNQFGRLDVLFNVAGINFRHAAQTFPVERLDDILAVNVRGNYLMARACGQRMVAQRSGKIINIASLHTFQSLAGVSVYGMSKGAIGSMTRALAVEWAAYNVQVNAIAPGIILTEFNRKLWDDPKMRNWVEDRTPAHRLGEPSDLVGTAVFLASAASDFITGHVLPVDGGFSAGSTWPLEVPQ